MTFMIAAAGTGGHVYPGLAVGEALLELGVDSAEILYVGGDRLEATVYPSKGFEFASVELAGLKRSLSPRNLRIPRVVMKARGLISNLIRDRAVKVVLAMGGYVTIPTALAARKRAVTFFNAEQNAEAGLANRMTARWAAASFTSFPRTGGLPAGEWAGNPVRRPFWTFDRDELRADALRHFAIEDLKTVGVFGGSLGAGAINDAVVEVLASWEGPEVQVVHLTGSSHLEALLSARSPLRWERRGFEERMELFYAVSDLVIGRAGGAVAELTATATPSILVPGSFGSSGHQLGNARFLEEVGASVVVAPEELGRLAPVLESLVGDEEALAGMAAAARAIAKPRAALTIARRMIEAAR